MRHFSTGFLVLCLAVPLHGQGPTAGPEDKKAQQTYQEGLNHLQNREMGVALWYFRKADKQDNARCVPCQEHMIQIGLATRDWKAVEDGASEIALQIKDAKQQAVAHHWSPLPS